MKKISLIIIITISFLSLFKCSPERRLARLVDKYPSLKVNHLDTIKINDTIIINEISYDTTKLIEYHDTTIIVNTEKIFARYIYDTITKEIYHEIKCLGDTITIIKEIPFEVEKLIYQENKPLTKYLNYGLIIIGLLILLAFLKQIRELFF
jgi:hypothetical protein